MNNFKSLSAEEKLQFVTDELKKRADESGERIVAYSNPKALKKLKEMYPDLPVQTMGTWTKQVLNKDAYVYLIEEGIAKSVRTKCLEHIEYIESMNIKKTRFLLESYDADLVRKLDNEKAVVLNYERCHWLLKDFYFVINDENQSPFEGNYWNYDSFIEPENNVKIISKANLTELLDKNIEKKTEKGKQHKDLFVTDNRDKKLNRAMKLFEKCVNRVEQYMDKTGDYNYPTASAHSRLEGKTTKANVASECAVDFFDAVVSWIKEKYRGTAFENEADILGKAYAETYEKILKDDFWFNGEIGVEYTVGLAVAVMIYMDPTATIEIEYVRDKWEFRGDYSASKRVCLEMSDYGYNVSVHYNKYEAYDM